MSSLYFKIQLKLRKKITLFMIHTEKDCHCLAVKNLSALLRRTASKHNGDFYS